MNARKRRQIEWRIDYEKRRDQMHFLMDQLDAKKGSDNVSCKKA